MRALCARPRPTNIDASAGAAEELDRIVKRIRGRWPETRVVIRGDAGFCREEIMAWCEANDVGYVLGPARNARLVRRTGKALRKSRRRCGRTGNAYAPKRITVEATSWAPSTPITN